MESLEQELDVLSKIWEEDLSVESAAFGIVS